MLLLAACTGQSEDDNFKTFAASPSAGAASDPSVARADSARIAGHSDAPVWIIEVSDFQCPYCKVWHDEVYPAVKREYVDSGKVRLAYVNFPLGQHRHARPAAEAALCAGAQGRFWEYHDALFDTQAEWTPLANADALFLTLGERVGLDLDEQRDCLDSDVMLPLIEADLQRMNEAGVGSTPSFFVGDEQLGNAPLSEFRRAIDSALERAGQAAP